MGHLAYVPMPGSSAAIKEPWRMAISYLQEPLFSLTDITELLGFAESGVFTRSFKRWFGVTPSKWRSRRFA